MQNYYVISGGPGVGKTTVLNELKNRGCITVAEDARRIIEEQIRTEGQGLPWKDKKLYTQLMLKASVESYRNISVSREDIVFFDRGILDAIGYSLMTGLGLTDEMNILVNELRYNTKVFILPPWFEIYETDEARKQSWEEAVQTFERIKKTYQDFGYKIIIVPPDMIEKRAGFILDNIDKKECY
jgi:predicted ATPase